VCRFEMFKMSVIGVCVAVLGVATGSVGALLSHTDSNVSVAWSVDAFLCLSPRC
jgi:hypothetical protein